MPLSPGHLDIGKVPATMTALPQTAAPRRSLRDRLMVFGIVFAAPAALISAVCVVFTSIG